MPMPPFFTYNYNPILYTAHTAQRSRLPTPRRVPCVTNGGPHHAHTLTGPHLDLADWASALASPLTGVTHAVDQKEKQYNADC